MWLIYTMKLHYTLFSYKDMDFAIKWLGPERNHIG